MSNPTSHQYSTPVVGGQFRRGVNWSRIKRGEKITVVSDSLGAYTKDNHRDPNALAVFVTQDGSLTHIGYFPKEIASVLGPHVHSGKLVINGVVSWMNGPSNLHVDYSIAPTSHEISMERTT